MRRFASALLVSAAVVGMAPFASEVRQWLEHALAEGYVRYLGAGFALAVAAVVVWVAARIKDDRARRYGLLLSGLALLFGQLVGWSRADAAVNAVERVHFLYYGLLGVLWLRALRGPIGVAAAGSGPQGPGMGQERGRADLSAPLATLLAILLVAIADEGLQFWVASRVGELYDVVLNVYAGAIGLLIALALDGPRSLVWRIEPGSGRALARLAAVSVLTLAAFLHVVHLGYLIVDPEIGTFRSHFTAEGLDRASRDRAERWRASPLGPPGVFAPLEREDRYRSEAGSRVQHRNAALERADPYQVWKENRILERYYAPFLEQRGRDGRPFRLPAETLGSIDQARPERDPYPYDSPVGRVPLRIWTRPSKPVLWAIATVVATALVLAPEAIAARRRRRHASATRSGADDAARRDGAASSSERP
ncbi:MAG TPA: hypothetical protein VMS86_06550 [Thermoanaerobaculia bacterium]|nr:hypothetical protein [Thermoanaerobaculia bacterium]